MGEITAVQILVGNSSDKKSLVKYRRRWEGDIKMKLR
jgi:hypothetical protein